MRYWKQLVAASVCALGTGIVFAEATGKSGTAEEAEAKEMRRVAEQALDHYLAFLAKGGTVGDLAKVASAANVNNYADDQGSLDAKTKIAAEDRYAKVTVTKVESSARRFVVYATVTYKPAWIKKEEDELKALGMEVDATKGGTDPERIRVKLDDPTMDVQHPFHRAGIGFVAFAFLKEGAQWKYHAGVASRVPVEVLMP